MFMFVSQAFAGLVQQDCFLCCKAQAFVGRSNGRQCMLHVACEWASWLWPRELAGRLSVLLAMQGPSSELPRERALFARKDELVEKPDEPLRGLARNGILLRRLRLQYVHGGRIHPAWESLRRHRR